VTLSPSSSDVLAADRSLHTPDLGRTATTANVTRAVSDALAGDNQA
jgi:tartrate dehydrogenase/decarboxylase/D-malate dehydrogenase